MTGRFHTCYSPVRRSPAGRTSPSPAAPRLACVKPVASVHPEPGSNSSLLSIFFSFLFYSYIEQESFIKRPTVVLFFFFAFTETPTGSLPTRRCPLIFIAIVCRIDRGHLKMTLVLLSMSIVILSMFSRRFLVSLAPQRSAENFAKLRTIFETRKFLSGF